MAEKVAWAGETARELLSKLAAVARLVVEEHASLIASQAWGRKLTLYDSGGTVVTAQFTGHLYLTVRAGGSRVDVSLAIPEILYIKGCSSCLARSEVFVTLPGGAVASPQPVPGRYYGDIYSVDEYQMIIDALESLTSEHGVSPPIVEDMVLAHEVRPKSYGVSLGEPVHVRSVSFSDVTIRRGLPAGLEELGAREPFVSDVELSDLEVDPYEGLAIDVRDFFSNPERYLRRARELGLLASIDEENMMISGRAVDAFISRNLTTARSPTIDITIEVAPPMLIGLRGPGLLHVVVSEPGYERLVMMSGDAIEELVRRDIDSLYRLLLEEHLNIL